MCATKLSVSVCFLRCGLQVVWNNTTVEDRPEKLKRNTAINVELTRDCETKLPGESSFDDAHTIIEIK